MILLSHLSGFHVVAQKNAAETAEKAPFRQRRGTKAFSFTTNLVPNLDATMHLGSLIPLGYAAF